MSVEVKGLVKKFGSVTALNNVDLQVQPGELLGLLGPSGSGKTTLLRVIGGLEIPDQGEVLLHGENVTRKSPAERGIGFVFQHYALFRHLTVFQNIAFGLEVRKRKFRPDKETIRRKVRELLQLVQLDGLENRLPAQLSGGQRQRVALARALAVEPKVLLLDEPFGALDAKVRKDLRRWIRRLHHQIHVTSVFVTHDQDEALEVADRVVVMNEGRIEQIGTPDQVYAVPANSFVYNFLGRAVSLEGHVEGGNLRLGTRQFPVPSEETVREGPAVVFARPEDVRLTLESNGSPGVDAIIRDVNYAGPIVYLELERRDDGSVFQLDVPGESLVGSGFKAGINVHLNLKKYRVFVRGDARKQG
jgi:sulfate transport system ATP-binding protein